jgi:hypothetical protein
MASLQRIRQKILDRAFHLSDHAEDERPADNLKRVDVEYAILQGNIAKRSTNDPRGTRYPIVGPARDGREVHVVCRFREAGYLIIMTV